jgi:N-acetylglucosamine-6-phosphate deacetylase
MQLFGRRYDTGQPVCLDVLHGRILRVTPAAIPTQTADDWPWIGPGLFDLQVNGYGGQEFSSTDLTPERVAEIVRVMESFGVTRFCPTLTTQAFEVLRHALRAIGCACESSPAVAKRIAGVHVEGPYISSVIGPRGAHPAEHCRRPDWDEFQRLQEAAGGRIRVLTMSVEFDESPPFIERVVKTGVVVAIGHTAADSAHIRRAVDAGARLSTHLGNGSHPLLPRHRNYLWDQLAEDRLMASIIGDGQHLPPEVVKTLVRAKTPSRCILVSDMSGLAGLAPGRYGSRLCEVEILEDGRLMVAGQRELLAGASWPIGAGVANVMHFAGVDLATAIRMATEHPARLLGLASGGLALGEPADLVQFKLAAQATDAGRLLLEVCSTWIDGEPVWGTPWQPAKITACSPEGP